MKITNAKFIKSAVKPFQYPLETMPEIAFVGRSNVGKSSLINTLTGRKNLAKTSTTPGRTQLINFFSINDQIYFVDLPGYGFAKVSKAVRDEWGEMIETYLRERRNLALIILILDIRRIPGNEDLSLRDWLDDYRIPYINVLTKSDKLSNNQALAQKKLIEKALGGTLKPNAFLFSSKSQKGKEELWKLIECHLASLENFIRR